jgi:hypothetical protein
MTHHLPACRTILTANLVFAGLAAGASAQDLYKSRAEMLNAEAANKQANATIISAIAGYDKTQAEIAKLGQEIREKGAQNDLLETEVYYKKRAQYHEYRAAHRPKANSPDGYTALARGAAPARLTSYQLGSGPGELRWPTVLKGSDYDATRREIDGLLKSRTPEDSGAGSQNCVDIVARLDVLKTELRDNIRRYKSHDYLAARKFLDAVALDAQEPAFSISGTVDKVAGR